MRQTTATSSRGAAGKRIKKRAYHHGDLKAAMIEAALKLIAKHGPRGFSLSEAARLAGVSVGAPYRHFADKEALFGAVAAQGFLELSERIEMAAKTCPDDPRKRLVAIGMTYVRFAVERPSHFQVMFDSAIHRRKDSAVDVPADRAYQILAETVHQAAVKKDVRSEETPTAATWALMQGHAMFAMDDSVHQHGVQDSNRHLGPRFIRAVGGNARSEQSLTGAHRVAESRTKQPSPGQYGLPQPLTNRERRESVSVKRKRSEAL